MTGASRFWVIVFLAIAAGAVGCATRPTGSEPPKGPHNGLLVEWGPDQPRAEFTLDHDHQQAVVYLLDPQGRTPSPLTVRELRLMLQRPRATVVLEARPQETDPPGTASCFVGRMPVPTRGRKFAGSIRGTVGGQSLAGDFDQQNDYVLRKK